ncbi:MAG: GAF domain-containing protein [Cyanobacteria bacterium J06623_4]
MKQKVLRQAALRQTALLEGVAEAARRLLAISDFDAAVNGALEAIALAAGIDRIYIFENHIDPATQQEFADCPYEWTAEGVVNIREIPRQYPFFYKDVGFEAWLAELKTGRAVQKLTSELSDAGKAKQGQEGDVLSLLTVPIFVEGQFWGLIGFDDCTRERVWGEAEIAVLQTAAANFAAALQQGENLRELEAHTQQLQQRDALLNSVNAASQRLVATDELAVAIPDALRILGEGTQQDRVYVFENVYPNGPDELFWDILDEWSSPRAIPIQDIAEQFPFPSNAFPEMITAPLAAGRAVQFLTRELEGAAAEANEDVETKSSVVVPILVAGHDWGVIGFDDCVTERVWSGAEIAVLETAAACIGSAIERDRTRKAREAAAQARAAEIEAHNLVLAGRDRILQATATASKILLTAESLEASINSALKVLGEEIGCDRIAVLENFGPSSTQMPDYQAVIYEWATPGTISQLSHAEAAEINCKGLEGFIEKYFQEDGFGGPVDDWDEPLRSAFKAVEIKSSYSVPIWLNERFWGVVGFDYCQQATLINSAEMSVLRTAAACIGSAIERDRTRKEKEAAAKARVVELAERDRILAATAAAANIMLTDEDFDSAVNQALQIVGEGLAVDRVGLGKYFESASPSDFDYHHFLFEWKAEDISSQMEHSELAKISDEGIEHIAETLKDGRIFGGIVEEMQEPFRSKMQQIDVQSTYAVPIQTNGRYWGLLGFDDCHKQTRRSEAELEALMTLANCIGSAVERENNKKEREAIAIARAAELAERDRILEATAAAANVMLTDNDFDSAVNQALQIVGEGLAVDRVGLGKQFEAASPSDFDYMHFLFEWDSEGTSSQMKHSELAKISNEGIEHIVENLKIGRIFGGIVEEMQEPFRSGQLELSVQSTYSIPIQTDGQYWGVITLDDCHKQTRRSEAELEALMTLANCIGSAISREKTQKERETAERKALIATERATRAAEIEAANQVLVTRDRWLQTTATAANQLLSSEDVQASVPIAIQTIGENLACDRVTVMQYLPTYEGHPLGAVQVLYEWDAPSISAQITDPDLNIISAEGIEAWFTQLLAGEWVGGDVADLPEPVRSGQQSLGVQSTYAMPVFFEGALWGLVAVDYCREAKRLEPSELAVFKTAATCVGSAIYQETVRRDRAAQERAMLLGSVAKAANLLLRSADYTQVLPEVVRLLGEAVDCDRCGVVTTHDSTLSLSSSVYLMAEWHKENIPPTHEGTPELDSMTWQQFSKFYECLTQEKAANYLVAELPEPSRGAFAAQGVSSVAYIPIVVNNEPWGQIGFDNCGEPRLYDEAEISILKVAAESIAAAIARQAKEKATREAEERYRTLIELSTEGIYRLELDEPISRDLPIREQIKLLYERAYGAEANDAFAKMYGYQSAEEMIGWRLTDIHVEASEQNIEFLSELARDSNYSISNSESEELDVSGNLHYFLNNVIGVIEDNRLIRLWGTQTDITELKQAQKDKEAAERAVLAEREKAARDRASELAKTNEAISRTLSTLAANPELDNFLCLLIKELSEAVNAHNTGLFLYNSDENTLYRHIAFQDKKAYVGAIPRDTEMLQRPFLADITDAWRLILESPQPITFADTGTPEENPNNFWWQDTVSWHISEGHKELACARLKVGNVPLGFIGFCFKEHRTFSAAQLEVIQALANQATLAIQFTRLAEEAKQAAILQEQEKAAKERAEKLAKANEAIAQTLTTLAASPELDQFLGTILAEMSRQLNAGKVHLFLYDQPTNTLTQRVVVQDGRVYLGPGPDDPEMFRQPISADITPGWDRIINGGAPLTYDETQPFDEEIWWPETIGWHKSQGHKAITCIPLKAGDVPIGYIGYCFYDRTCLSNEQLEFMQALANQAIVAIQLTRLGEEAKQAAILQEQEKAAQDRVTELAKTNEALGQTLSVLTTTPELDDFLGRILCKISEPVQACKALLFLYNEEAHTLHAHLSVHDWEHVYKGTAPNDPEMFHHPIPADISPAWNRIINSSKPWMLEKDNPADANLWWPESLPWNRAEGHCAAICAVMKVGGDPIGFIALTFRSVPTLTDEQLEFIQALTNQATLAIHLTRLADASKTAALSVALTNERNRLAREIHDTLAQAFTGVSLQLEAAKSAATEDFEDALYHITRAGNLARQGLSEARRSVRALRSHALETGSLPDALRTSLKEMTQSSPTQAKFVLKGKTYPLPEDIQTNLLRIGQEATTNTLRHAQANTLTLTLEFAPDQIHMTITDDGKGCKVTSLADFEGFGLVGMRERVHRFDGQFSFSSTPGKGTAISIAIPIAHPSAAYPSIAQPE